MSAQLSLAADRTTVARESIELALYQSFLRGVLGFELDVAARTKAQSYLAELTAHQGVVEQWQRLQKGMSTKARYAGRGAARRATRDGRQVLDRRDVEEGIRQALAVAESASCMV